jgi:hypothetical protein
VIQSSLSRIDRNVRTFSCNVLKIEGDSRRIEIASEAATVRAAGVEAEKTKAVPLMRWKRVRKGEKSECWWEAHLMLNNDGRSGTETTRCAETGGDRTDQHVNLGGRDIVKLGETSAGSSNSSERESLVEDEAVLVLVLEFDLRTVKLSSWLDMLMRLMVPISANRPSNRRVRKYPL